MSAREAPADGRPIRSPVAVSPLTLRQSLVLIGAVLAITAVVLGTAVLAILFVPGARAVGLTVLAWSLLAQALLSVGAVHVCLRRHDTGWTALGFARPTARLLHLLWQLPVGFITLIAVQGIGLLLIGEVPQSSGSGIDSLAQGGGPLTVVAILLAVAILTPLWEEAVFRGVIQGGFLRRLRVVPAALLSALVFAAAHGVPILLPYMITLGLILAFLRQFHRTLWGPLIFHVILNSIANTALLAALTQR